MNYFTICINILIKFKQTKNNLLVAERQQEVLINRINIFVCFIGCQLFCILPFTQLHIGINCLGRFHTNK